MLASYKAFLIAASTNLPLLLCSPNSAIDLVRRDSIYNLILYSSKFVFSLKSCYLLYLINSKRISTPVSDPIRVSEVVLCFEIFCGINFRVGALRDL